MSVAADDRARYEIAAEVLRAHESSYGLGAERVTVHLLDDLVLVMLDELELSLAERTLIEEGDPESMLRARAAFQRAIESTVNAIVERSTGRRVASFVSATSLTPSYSVEVFRLHPARSAGGGRPGPR